MPRILVTTDAVPPVAAAGGAVLLDEHVHSIHLSTDHAATQLIERVAWAVNDAERAEGGDGAAEPSGATGEGKRADRARGAARERRRPSGAAAGPSGARRPPTLVA